MLTRYNSLDFYDIGCDNSTGHKRTTIGNCDSIVHAQQNCVFEVQTNKGPQIICALSNCGSSFSLNFPL
jgi:hypothetical protein|eukprot:COSAG01_NODE_1187_length_11337_cov_185.267574_15_plen_69_part_00